MEVDILGTSLSAANQMAVEIVVENLAAKSGHTLVFQRHNAIAVFGDGTRRYPIDPMKVYQKNRVNKIGAYFLFGISGYIAASAADDDRRGALAKAGRRELRLDRDASNASGFLFFDTEGIAERRLQELIVDYEEVGVDKLWRVRLDMGGVEIHPIAEASPPPREQDRRDNFRGIDW